MSAVETGGPAFPVPSQDVQMIEGRRYDLREEGMTLRDYFAAKALMALDIQAHVARPAAQTLAKSAYEIADAMLEARK